MCINLIIINLYTERDKFNVITIQNMRCSLDHNSSHTSVTRIIKFHKWEETRRQFIITDLFGFIPFFSPVMPSLQC